MNYTNVFPGVFCQLASLCVFRQLIIKITSNAYIWLAQSRGWALLWHPLYLRSFLAWGGFSDFRAAVQHVQQSVVRLNLQHPGSFCIVATFSYSCSLPHFFLSSLPFFPCCPWQNGFEPLFVFEIDNNTNTIKRRPGTRKQVKSMRCVAVVVVLPYGVLCSSSLCLLVASWIVTTTC